MGHTPAEAERKYQEIASLVDIRDALHYLGRYFNDIDFTQFDLDAPFPDLGDFARNGWESTTDKLKHLAREEHLTLRQLALRTTTPKSVFMGTPTHIADTMQAWFEAGAADGFMISGAVLPDGLTDFIDHVLPFCKSAVSFGPNTKPTPCVAIWGYQNRRIITPSRNQETANIHVTVSS